MFLRPHKHKSFDYTPQFYNPDKDKDIRGRINFTRRRRPVGRKRNNIIKLLLLLAAVIYLIIYLRGKI